jgi:hypothetical protein
MAFYLVTASMTSGKIVANGYTTEKNAFEGYKKIVKNPETHQAYLSKIIRSYQSIIPT